MDRPRVANRSDDLEMIGLAHLYPALEWNVCVPGHHGYLRALDLIRVSARPGERGDRAAAIPLVNLSVFISGSCLCDARLIAALLR